MDKIAKLTRLNVELEGLLHVLAKRDTSDLRTLLGEKYSEFKALFEELMADGEVSDEKVEETIEDIDKVLTQDEVKSQEAVSEEVEPEDDLADQAICEEEKIGVTPAEDFDPENLAMAGEPEQTEKETFVPTAEKEEVATDPEEVEPQTHDDEFINDPSLFDTAEIVSVSLEEFEETDEHEDAPRDSVEPELAPAPEPTPVEEPLGETVVPETPAEENLRVDEMLTRRSAEDLKRAFTLNDKFRFRRELFGQNDEAFRETLETLNEMTSFDEAGKYVTEKFATPDNAETIADFLAIIKPHYN